MHLNKFNKWSEKLALVLKNKSNEFLTNNLIVVTKYYIHKYIMFTFVNIYNLFANVALPFVVST